MLFQTCMNFFLLLNTKEYILKNVGEQQLMVAMTSIDFFFHTMEVNGYRQLLGVNRPKKHTFGTFWGRVNDDKFSFPGETITLKYYIIRIYENIPSLVKFVLTLALPVSVPYLSIHIDVEVYSYFAVSQLRRMIADSIVTSK